ncbi:MAG: hypothetical protein QGH42_11575 [Kiritimatiellia bacterium]|jgi:hypothetical protein|nr:hypothetical protein [Kiritimatiellia bacterium]MDP6810092.1 hypothetical protein [Kiritimatiellia bacterium]MDP7024863.1 hypothetical protein [Kiritimatiellia bacterium]
MKVLGCTLLIAVGVMAAGCGGIDKRDVYRIARDHVEQQAGKGVKVSSRDEALFAIGKSAARVDVDYNREFPDPVEGIMTVWCKRVRMRWEFERSIDSRSAGTPTQP